MLFIGHSHLAAIRAASEEAHAHHRFIALTEFRRPVGGRRNPGFSLELKDAVERNLDGDRVIVSCVAGNQHQVLALFSYDPPFQIYWPGQDRPVGEGVEVPFGAVRAMMVSQWAGQARLLTALKEELGVAIIHLHAPPPLADNVVVIQSLLAHTQTDLSSKVCPPHLRMAFWQLQQEAVTEAFADIGVEFVPPPPEAIGHDGFLRPDLASDPTHGNAAYGAVVLDQIDRIRLHAG